MYSKKKRNELLNGQEIRKVCMLKSEKSRQNLSRSFLGGGEEKRKKKKHLLDKLKKK